MATIEELETKIEEAIRKRLADGWTIRPRRWVDFKDKECCALGAVIVPQVPLAGFSTEDQSMIDLAAKLLETTPAQLVSFIDGFDKSGVLTRDPTRIDALALGSKLREKYWRT